MQANLDRLGGLVHSQRVLLALTQAGMEREAAYAAVQENAMEVWRGRGKFLDLLSADPRIAPVLSRKQLATFFDNEYHLAHVDTIFRRVFGRA
jgi:adenylosuccinate lyase